MPRYRVSLTLTSPSGVVTTDTVYFTVATVNAAREQAFLLCQSRIAAGYGDYAGKDIVIAEPEEAVPTFP